jgi:hypothetical protein
MLWGETLALILSPVGIAGHYDAKGGTAPGLSNVYSAYWKCPIFRVHIPDDIIKLFELPMIISASSAL